MTHPRRRHHYRTALFIIFALLLCSAIFFNLSGIVKTLLYYDDIKKHSLKYGIDPLMVVSMIYAESAFIPSARSHKGAIGLMQILPATYNGEIKKDLNMPDDISVLKHPSENIKAGVYYLSKLKKERWIETDVELLAAYNAGRGKALGWKKKSPSGVIEPDAIPYKETRDYVKKVTSTYLWLKKIKSEK